MLFLFLFLILFIVAAGMLVLISIILLEQHPLFISTKTNRKIILNLFFFQQSFRNTCKRISIICSGFNDFHYVISTVTLWPRYTHKITVRLRTIKVSFLNTIPSGCLNFVGNAFYCHKFALPFKSYFRVRALREWNFEEVATYWEINNGNC